MYCVLTHFIYAGSVLGECGDLICGVQKWVGLFKRLLLGGSLVM